MEAFKEVAEAWGKLTSIKVSVGTMIWAYILFKVYKYKGDAIVHFLLGGINGILTWIF